ncbi:MAG: hypothetical protein WD471_01970 [Candidatus Paceibacterota bacterium]
MSIVNLAVADTETREMVNSFKKVGFPSEVDLEEIFKDLDQKHKDVLSSIHILDDKEYELTDSNPHTCKKGDDLWNIRQEIREKLREAIKAGLIVLGIVRRNAVLYGAIPDPDEEWKYYRLPDMTYACWSCGEEILVKTQHVSIHDGPFPMSGSGRVEHKQIPYCPSCEEVPSRSSVKQVPFALG